MLEQEEIGKSRKISVGKIGMGGRTVGYEYGSHICNLCLWREPLFGRMYTVSLNQKTESKILIATSTPNRQILEMGEKYDIPIFVNYLEKGLAGDWNFAYNCANTLW